MIDRNEFNGWMTRLHEDVRECRDHLRSQNGRLGTVESKVAVLESHVGADKTARATGIGAALASAGALVWQWLKP